MKPFSFIFLLLTTLCSQAKNYYVSATGNDAGDGLTTATAWQSISKINSYKFASGDVVLFKRGDTFYGSIVVPTNNISFDAYGTGTLPVITGFTTLTSWTSIGGGIYQAPVPAVKNAVNMVTINDIPQEVGRYPNADATNGGYLTVTGFSGNTQLTAAGLSGTDWTGAEVVARKRAYVVERNKVTFQSGSTVTYAPSIQTINPRNDASAPVPQIPVATGFGLFIQRDARTLDKFGEWYYDPSLHVMKMYFGSADPNAYSIKMSTLDTLINIGTKSYITVNNLNLTGANLAAVFFYNSSNITVTNCTISNSGAKGVFGWYTPNTLIDGNAISYSLCSAIDVRSPANNVTVSNNKIKNSGMFNGMSSFYDPADDNAVYVGVGNTAIIRKNSIDSTGYTAIHFDGSDITVDSNYIHYYCSNRDDGGGIYTWNSTNTKRIIKNNIILHGVGAPLGTQEIAGANGIYTDDGAPGVDIINNTISGNKGSSFAIFMNSPKDITVRGNTVYDANGWYVSRQHNGSIYNFSFKKNITFNTLADQLAALHTNDGLNAATTPVVTTVQQSLQQLGVVDSNYYNLPNAAAFSWYYATTVGGAFIFPPAVSLSGWQSYSGLDAHSVTVASGISRFEYNATNVNKTVSLGSNVYKDVYGTTYTGDISIAPYTSIILISNGSVLTNQPPVANAGADKAILLPANSATLTGSGKDADGTISNYAWTQIAGPSNGTIATVNAAQTVLNNLLQGVYKYQLTVTDNAGATAKDTVQVTVNAALAIAATNQAPVANAGADKTITLPAASTTITGSGTDSDGKINTYAWAEIAGPSAGIITGNTTATATISNLVQGVYKYQLTVTDNAGASAKDTIQVIVAAAQINPATNKIPVANAGADKVITLPANSVTLSGTGTDADGTISSFTWVKLSGPATGALNSAKAATITISGLVKGVYQYELTVTDNAGATAKDIVQVTVNPTPAIAVTNKAPVANAGTDKTITLPVNSATLTGTGTDIDGKITSYIWTKIAGPASGSVATANAAQTIVNNLVAGVYKYELTVTDNAGVKASDTLQVTVKDATVITLPNKAPVANAGADKTITLPTSAVSLTGSATDADGTVSSYAWLKISGPAGGTIVTANAANTSITNLAKGLYKYALLVKDNKGLAGTDTVQVIVNEAPQPILVANAGSAKTVLLPTNTASLSGSVTVKNTNVSSYAWIKIAGPASGSITDATAAVTTVNDLAEGLYKFEFIIKDAAGRLAKDTLELTVTDPRQLSNSYAFRVYPNPVKDITNLEIKAGLENTQVSLFVVDMNGKVADRKQFTTTGATSNIKLNMSSLIDGMYIVNLVFENGKILSTKVMKIGMTR